LGAALVGLVAGGVLYWLVSPFAASIAWAAVTLLALVPAAYASLRTLLRGETGVDLIAVLAMAGALLLGQELAGAIVGVMLTGGASLERFAVARARGNLSALLRRAPRVSHVRREGGIVEVDVDEVQVGDELVVRSGEVVPTDGILIGERAVLDESALTGESRPVVLEEGAPLRSGATNAGGPLELRVTVPAAKSTYASIIRLVREAEGSKAHFVRLADRYALVFLLATVVLAGGAWAVSGDPVRALAVLVVATPCPLILAAPAAIVSGVSRAAKHGIIVKGGEPLETLSRTRVLLLDKTGTVTSAKPRVVAVEALDSHTADELVHLAASIEQASLHPYAPAILTEARRRHQALIFPEKSHEEMGLGIEGWVGEKRVAVGQLAFVAPEAARSPRVRAVELRSAVEGSAAVFVAIDGALAGALLLQDTVRPEASRVLRNLRAVGVEHLFMVTGDRPDVAEVVGEALGVDRVFAERSPREKVEVVRRVRAKGITAMVGDGINDAPALAVADVGIAMGAAGASAASEAADVVLTADRLEGLHMAIQIAKRTRGIAELSVFLGMGLSVVAMGFAAGGALPPVAGAILQEGIDVLVILNALRALGGGGLMAPPPEAAAVAGKFAAAHPELLVRVDEFPALAARLGEIPPEEARVRLEGVCRFLVEELLPHEMQEQEKAYPILAETLQPEDPTGPLVHTHHEIRRLVRAFGRQVEHLPAQGPGPDDLHDLRRSLYGLYAILTMHFAQEEELYSAFEA
jgi:heavy metal translocating P-type ATPase